MPLCRWLLIALLASPASLPLAAQAAGPVQIARAAGDVVLDGRADEPAWSGIAPHRFTMLQPTAGLAPTDPAELRLAYDDRYLYVAGTFLVARATDIRASSLTRDRLSSDDVFRILLDTYDDNENGLVFAVTPAGTQVDYTVADDGAETNESWNTHWDAATARDERGWYAELRIPLSSLRFQVTDSGTAMGVIATRYTARRNELVTFPALSPRFANAAQRPSLARSIVLPGLRSRRPLYLSPYALAGGSRLAELDPGAGAFDHERSTTLELGGDVKYGLAENLVLDLTANTDFAQVEADDEQINLTRFSLFFPEKRQFFLERSALFGVPTGTFVDGSLFFHSRRLGLSDMGRPLRIYGGARMSGRTGEWDVGALDLQTETADRSSSENLGVMRVRRRIVDQQSTAGAIATTRMGAGSRRLDYALDARLRAFGDDYLLAQWGQSTGDGLSERPGHGGMARLAWERPGTLSSQGLAYVVGLKWSGPEFDPSLGFQPRRDFTHTFANARFGFYPARSAWRVVQPSLVGSQYRSNRDGSVESGFVAAFLNYELRSGVNGWVGWNHSAERLVVSLELGEDAAVPPGLYRFDALEAVVNPPVGSDFRIGAQLEVGSFYDGRKVTFGVSPSWTVSEHLELSLGYVGNRIRFRERGVEFDTDLVQLRVQAAADAKLSAGGFVQYNRAADAVVANARVRYRFAEGRDLWLVYNERLNTDRDRGLPLSPELPTSQERTLLLKYTHTMVR